MKKYLFLFLFFLLFGCSKKERIPSFILLESVTISNIPQQNQEGLDWDASTRPDLEFRIFHFNGNYGNRTNNDFDFANEIKIDLDITLEFGDLILVRLVDIDEQDEDDVIVSESVSII